MNIIQLYGSIILLLFFFIHIIDVQNAEKKNKGAKRPNTHVIINNFLTLSEIYKPLNVYQIFNGVYFIRLFKIPYEHIPDNV
jgi:hypothetical protein